MKRQLFTVLVCMTVFAVASCGENKEKLSLNSDDYKILEDFFKTLGSSGISGQEKIFSLALENIDINYKEAKKKEKENIKLYRTLGISIGAMLAIFFI